MTTAVAAGLTFKMVVRSTINTAFGGLLKRGGWEVTGKSMYKIYSMDIYSNGKVFVGEWFGDRVTLNKIL